MSSTLNVTFGEGKIIARVGGLWQWDLGQKVRIIGTGITQDVEIHFSLMEKGGSATVLTAVYDSSIDALTVDIPDYYLGQEGLTDYKLYAWLYVQDSDTAETVYKIIMTVKARPKPEDYDSDSLSLLKYMVSFEQTDNEDPTCDRTHDDIIDALKAGKYVAAVFTKSYTGNESQDVTYLNLIVADDDRALFGFAGIEYVSGDESEGSSWLINSMACEISASGTVKMSFKSAVPATFNDLSGTVGENVAGQTFTVDEVEITAGEGAERFNDYTYNAPTGGHSHAEGGATTAAGNYSHAEGLNTKALGTYGHVEGVATVASGEAAHAEGKGATASNEAAHAEGMGTAASGARSHAEGWGCNATEQQTHAEGSGTTASGVNSHSEGGGTTASGSHAHAEGAGVVASGKNCHAEGEYTTAAGETAHSEGYKTVARGAYSHAEGEESSTSTYAQAAHAEGYYCEANGRNSHAEGSGSVASAQAAHAEGGQSTASGVGSHSEGMSTTASAEAAHAEGEGTTASGYYAHAEGLWTEANSTGSHAEGQGTIAGPRFNQHVQGMYNIADTDRKYIHIVGNGTDSESRSNAHTIDGDGVCWYAGDILSGGTDQDNPLVSLQDIAARLAAIEASLNNG